MAQAEIIRIEARADGQNALDLAVRIVANADAYRAAVGLLTGLRLRALKAIDNATTVAGVTAAVAGCTKAWGARR